MNAPVQFALYDPASLYSIEVEQEILGAILHAGGVVIDAVDRIITATDFHEPVHKKLYAGFVDAHSKGRAITLTLAIAALGADGRMELMEGVTTGDRDTPPVNELYTATIDGTVPLIKMVLFSAALMSR